MIIAQIVPDDALLEEIAQAAKVRGWHIITNGRRAVVSPVVPAGWVKLAVKIKTPATAYLEAMPCAA